MARVRKRQDSPHSKARVDQLVATYASRGAERKRRQLIRRICFTGGLAVVVASGVLVSTLGIVPVSRDTNGQSAEAVENLADERALLLSQIAELERQIESVIAQKQDLENQRIRFDDQSEALASLLSDVAAEQARLEQRGEQGTQLDQEIAAIAAQRKALEKRWAQFEAQGELLAVEIVAVNAQRRELEMQRRQIDRQTRELAELLEKAEGLYRHKARSADADPEQNTSMTAVDEEAFGYDETSLMVGNGELDKMRGGFRTGEGLDVSFGFTQSGSLNGVEQFRNSFTIDNMASGISDVDISNMDRVLLQNGDGNFSSFGTLDSLSNGFGNVIQNTLDNQQISTTTIFDLDLHNVSDATQGIYGEQAVTDSLSLY